MATNLLEEIERAAIDDSQALAGLLRKCLVLAYRLGHQPFRESVEQELHGYPADAIQPKYRIARGDFYASLSGPLQGYVASVPVPLSQIRRTIGSLSVISASVRASPSYMTVIERRPGLV